MACLFAQAAGLFAQGTGLTGQYYDTATFGTLRTTRTDATVNFNFGTGIPAGTGITNADSFSIAWSGQIEPEFTGLYTFYVTADDGARLWVNDQMVVSRTFFASPTEMRGQVNLKAGQRVNVRLEYIEQTGGASVKLEWSCASRAREVIPTARLYPSRVDKVGGSLLKEHWSGISGALISSLTSNANYPNKPGGREFITSFECLAQDWVDSYGTRVTGFIVPPVTGSYTFAVSGDDVVELYLSTDATSANKSLAASVGSATAFRAWGTASSARTLTQGVRYYVELLHKESTGTDHWSVGWRKPGDASFSVVPGSALVQPGTTTAQPAETSLLNTMAQEHPRIFATAERFAKLKAAYLSPTASQAKTWATSAINSANTILTQAPVTYAPDVRGTILSESRTVKDRMYKLAVAWWMTGDAQYAERAWTELNTVANNTLFPNWNPSHFLDVAEMTHACAIGYDWFYHYWDTTRRTTIRTAIINKGLNPGLSQFTSNAWWSQSDANNWNQVCNGGLTMGALAVGTESEALVENILNRAINSTRPCWKHFTTDNGAWYEGPGYWGYTTEYGVRMLAALEWVLGSDFGIGATQNVSESGFAPILSLGTSNVIFNYADSGAGGASRGPVFQWMARRYGQPVFDWWNNQGSGGALDALWWNDSTSSPAGTAQQPDMAFHGEAGTAFQPQEMVTMRGKWNDSRATFVGVKAGQMGADHGNLDAGTFVLDALGKRWFHDLGSDNYALPNYFNDTSSTGTDRWDYYRMRPEGQNTLAINPDGSAGMTLGAVAPLLSYQTEPGGTSSFAIHDLTPVYSGMTKVWRDTRLMGARNQVLVQDEIQASTAKTVWWFAHYTHPTTSVTIDPDGTSAMLTQGAERLWVKIVGSGGTFQIKDAVPLPGSANPITTPAQNPNTGHKKLAINLTNVTNTTLAVWFVPLQTGDTVPTTLPAVTPLNTWNVAASNDAPVAINGVATSSGENAVDIDLRNYITDDNTPGAQMRFGVSGPVNGTVVLLADGYTARFTPTPGYTGVPSFSFTATDAGGNADTMLVWDFDLPDGTATNIATDASGNGRDGTIDFAAAGTYSLVTDKPASLVQQGARSIDLVEDGTNATRVQRVFTAAELDWNLADWSVAGWFKRRDTTNDDMVWHISDGDGFGGNDELYLNCPAGQTTVHLQHFNPVGEPFDVDIAKTGIVAGTWYHFAVVRDGTSISLYIDGMLVGTDSAFALALNQSSPLVFGGHASNTFQPGRWFDGGLDDLLVSKAVLDGAQISTLAGGMTARHFGGLSSTASISLSAAAVNYVWTSTSSGNWSAGANWQSGAAPTGTRGASVQFFT
ncbi:MAG: PA14 domain-containing protein, partial [Chthoniobacteraceae bacterium]